MDRIGAMLVSSRILKGTQQNEVLRIGVLGFTLSNFPIAKLLLH